MHSVSVNHIAYETLFKVLFVIYHEWREATGKFETQPNLPVVSSFAAALNTEQR